MNSQYHAFLLRLQRNETAEHWRMTVENAHTGEKLHFASEEELMRFLWEIVGEGRLLLATSPAQSNSPSNHSQNNLIGRK